MKQSQTRIYQVRARTQEVVDHHFDDAKPGKPLRWLIPGGILALVSLSLAVYIVDQTWDAHKIKPSDGLRQILLLAPLYIVSVFIWS